MKEELMRGKLIWFNEAKDLGFIQSEAGERLEVKGDSFAGGTRPVGRVAGIDVTFKLGDAGRTAEDVSMSPDMVQRRARLRHGNRSIGS